MSDYGAKIAPNPTYRSRRFAGYDGLSMYRISHATMFARVILGLAALYLEQKICPKIPPRPPSKEGLAREPL